MNSPKTLRSLKSTVSKSLALCLLAAPCSLFAQTSTWDGGGGDGLWETAANWNPDGVPGSSGNTGASAGINGVFNVSLTSDVTLGALSNTLELASGANLTIGTGAVLPAMTALRLDQSTAFAGGSSLIFNDGSWFTGSSSSISRISIGNDSRVTGTTKLQINGGTISNLGAGANARIDIGQAAFTGTSVLEVTGGTLVNSASVNFNGAATSKSHFLISGGSVSVNVVDMDNSTANGKVSLIRVTGDAATINFGGTTTLAKNASNLTGSSTAEFVFDNTGISQITTSTLNLGTGADKGLLDVDVSLLDSDGTIAFNLFTYTTLQNGTFGSVSVNYGATALSLGTFNGLLPNNGLAQNEYFLSYGEGSSDSIQLYYNVVPEPSTWALLVGTLAVMAVFRRRRRA